MDVGEFLERYGAGVTDFRGADLSNVALSQCELCGIDLSRANLNCTSIRNVDFSEVNFTQANLQCACLE